MRYPHGPHTLWLAMSGGGTRAALFHYGALKRLHELGLLQNVEVISATSGGALVAALLGVHGPLLKRPEIGWEDFEQDLLDAAVRGLLGPAAWSVVALLSSVLVSIVGIIVLRPWLEPGPTALSLFSVCFTVFASAVLATARQLHLIERNSGTLRRVRYKGRWRDDSSPTVTTNSRPRITDRFKRWSDRFFLTLSPRDVRWHTLNFRVFRNSHLDDFRGPKIFLCAADLNSGHEVIFSKQMLCKLDGEWVHKLWKNYDTDAFLSLGEGKDIKVATAVAASSAYPPFFSSVPVIIKKRLKANCIDGGVIDNHALIVARQMAKYVVNPEAYVGGWTFCRTIGRVLALDASAPMRLYERHFWSRLSTLLRLADVLHHRQVQGVFEAVDDIRRLFNVPADAIGLHVSPDDDCALRNPEIAQLAARVRTHFDPFSKVECAVLAYLGYYWANRWAINDFLGRKPPKPQSPNNVPMRGIGDILPARFAPPAAMLTDSEILAHLRFSHLRFRRWRWLRRYIARIYFRSRRIMRTF